MRHIDLLYENGYHQSGPASKTLIDNLTGRYYTPEIIGRHLARTVAQKIKFTPGKQLNVLDPFAGDGRLISWLLDEISSIGLTRRFQWHFELWDCDKGVLPEAEDLLKSKARKLGFNFSLVTKHVDSFKISPSHFGNFQIVVTNPPWEAIKPDRRYLEVLIRKDIEEYLMRLREQDKTLAQLYPLSQPEKKFSGWGTNLARCGTEAALRLISSDGICGLISPASLFADQMTVRLRQWILRNHRIHLLSYYPAEARLFKNVDQPCVTLVATPEETKGFSSAIEIFDPVKNEMTCTPFHMTREELERIDYVLPLHFGVEQLSLLRNLSERSAFRDLEGTGPSDLWAGRELDETGSVDFLSERGEYLFVKGRMIGRFSFVQQPMKRIRRDGPSIPVSAEHYRIGWRDVSRPNQKRRMQATIIPPKHVTGNSINISYFRDDNMQKLKALLAIMNSLVFEFQARVHLATAHVSLGAVRKVRLPNLDDLRTVQQLAAIADNCSSERISSHAALEVEVAKLYGLSHDNFGCLVSAFPKISKEERDELLGHWGSKRR